MYEDYLYHGLQELYDDNVLYLELRSTIPALYELDGTKYDKLSVAKIMKNVSDRYIYLFFVYFFIRFICLIFNGIFWFFTTWSTNFWMKFFFMLFITTDTLHGHIYKEVQLNIIFFKSKLKLESTFNKLVGNMGI